GRVMLTLAGGFADRGHDVDLVLVRAEGDCLADVPSNVRLVTLGRRRTVYSVPRLVRYLRKERPVALVSALVHVNVAAILAARLAGGRPQIVVTEHNQIARDSARPRSTAGRLPPPAPPRLLPSAAC